jgi:MFS family permease
VHALHAAGDALVAVALAGTLFFDVPLGEARTSVGLYLLLTMLPFALLVPVAGPLLDRFPHGRRNVLAVTTGGRGLLTWVMAGATASLGLYPLALAVLVLSRAYGVARCAAVPRVRPPAVGLVSANARLNVAAVAAGAAAAGLGSGWRLSRRRTGCCGWPASCC